jgi:hypothetical protein
LTAGNVRYVWTDLQTKVPAADQQSDVLVWLSWSFREKEFEQYRNLFPEQWRLLKGQALLRKICADTLVVKKTIIDQANLFQRQYFSDNVIGVHVRYTDNRQGVYAQWVGHPEAYFSVIEDLLRKSGHSQIFLCTDNYEIVEMFRRRFPGIIVREKFFPPEGQAIHFFKECPDKVKMAEDALVEMILLSRCQYLVHSGSSFVRFARLFAQGGKDINVRIGGGVFG